MYPVSREMLAWQVDTNSLPSLQCTTHHRICQFSLLMHFNHVPKFSLSKLVDRSIDLSDNITVILVVTFRLLIGRLHHPLLRYTCAIFDTSTAPPTSLSSALVTKPPIIGQSHNVLIRVPYAIFSFHFDTLHPFLF